MMVFRHTTAGFRLGKAGARERLHQAFTGLPLESANLAGLDAIG